MSEAEREALEAFLTLAIALKIDVQTDNQGQYIIYLGIGKPCPHKNDCLECEICNPVV